MHRVDRKHVLMFAGGGLSHVSGGVGTLTRYLMAAWALDPTNLPVRVIDTRGAGGPASAALHFCRALIAMLRAGVTRDAVCAHIHMTTRGSALRKALLCAMARPLGLHTVLQLHGADFFDFQAALPGPARWALRACIGGADCIVVMGAQWRDRVVSELGMPQSRIRVVPNGAPGSPMAARGGNPARILFLGRLGDRKGVPELVQALASPQLAARDWRAMIAGDGDLAALETRLTATGLRARVDAPGWLDSAEAARALDQTDILVLPSHHEVMPIAILEAMARGLAIVATPVGVIPEILTDNINGRLVPPGDASSLVEALSALLDEPALRHRLGERARETFAARLDIAIPAATLQAIYRQLDARSRRGPGRRMASACPSDLT